MSAEVYVHGVQHLLADLRKKQLLIEKRKLTAAGSAANVIKKFVRAEARKHRGSGIVSTGVSRRTGKTTHHTRHLLETRVVRQPIALDGWMVRDRAPHAHLLIEGHRIVGHAPNKTFTGKHARKFPFVHEAFLLAKQDAFIAARASLFEGAPEVPDQ